MRHLIFDIAIAATITSVFVAVLAPVAPRFWRRNPEARNPCKSSAGCMLISARSNPWFRWLNEDPAVNLPAYWWVASIPACALCQVRP